MLTNNTSYVRRLQQEQQHDREIQKQAGTQQTQRHCKRARCKSSEQTHNQQGQPGNQRGHPATAHGRGVDTSLRQRAGEGACIPTTQQVLHVLCMHKRSAAAAPSQQVLKHNQQQQMTHLLGCLRLSKPTTAPLLVELCLQLGVTQANPLHAQVHLQMLIDRGPHALKPDA